MMMGGGGMMIGDGGSGLHRRLVKMMSSADSTMDDANGEAAVGVVAAFRQRDAGGNASNVVSNTGAISSAYGARSTSTTTAMEFDAVVNSRYACTRFQRHREEGGEEQQPRHKFDFGNDDDGDHHHGNDGTTTASSSSAAASASSSAPSSAPSAPPAASISDEYAVRLSHECVSIARRAPTGFNAQPYRVVLVHSKHDKERLARYCLGRNADRVRDSDCTAVFLADRECGRDGGRYQEFLLENMATDTDAAAAAAAAAEAPPGGGRTRRPLSPRALLKLRGLILLFSSGYPLPRFLSVPLSLGVRSAVSVLAFLARCLESLKRSSVQLLPTLSSAETWSTKNAMLVAMTYMLACASRGLATCPMEGFDAPGVRRALGVPGGRYGVPIIVSTGMPHRRSKGEEEEEETDDVGLSHGKDLSPRFPLDEVVYGNAFGRPFRAA